MSELTKAAHQYLQSKLEPPKKPAFERLTVAGLARRREAEMKLEALEDRNVVMEKLHIPMAALTNGEVMGKMLGEVTNRAFSLFGALRTYATAAGKAYLETVKPKEPTSLPPAQCEFTREVATRIMNKETFEADLPTGEHITVVHGEVSLCKR
jgi:hypothetical protein